MKVTLSFGQRRFLLMLADRGRTVRMVLNLAAIGAKAMNGIDHLRLAYQLIGNHEPVPPIPLITCTPVPGGTADEHDVWLNDYGAQLVDQMKDQFKDEVAKAREEGSMS